MNDINHTARAHALLSASRVKRVMDCPGSLNLEESVPPEPAGEAAARGTAIHEISETLYEGGNLPEDTPQELIDIAQRYVDTLRSKSEGLKRTFIEMNVTDALRTIHPALGGMADFIGIGGGEMLVADLKTGRIKVEAEANRQLMTYGLGAAIALKAPPHIRVRLAIYQPDCGGWSEWACTVEDLMEWSQTLQELAVLATSSDAPRKPSEDACRYCRAKTICPELRERVVQAARVEFDSKDPTEVTPEMLEDAVLATAWADAVQAAAKAQLTKTPDSIKGWKLRPGRSMTKWKDGLMARALLEGKPDCWDLKSPSAVQKLGIELPAGLIEETRAAASLVKEK